MRHLTRPTALTLAALLFLIFGLSQAASHFFTASSASQPSAVNPAVPALVSAIQPDPVVSASSLRGSLSLFNWGPGFYGICYNGREGFPNSDPPWVACADDWTETITTYNLHAGLERLVRIPRMNGTFGHSKPRLSPDGTKIVYAEVGEDGYNLEIYVMNSDGTDPVNLTNYPSVSQEDPDAVFRCRYAPGPNEQISNAFRCMDTEPAWSADGQHIVFVSGRAGSRQLYVMKADGSDLTPLETRGPAFSGGGAFEPVWSPDGEEIAYSLNRREIASVTLDSVPDPSGDGDVIFSAAEDEPVIAGAGSHYMPAWSPDGMKLAFFREEIDIFNNRLVWDIYTVRADGSGETKITDTPELLEHHPVWSPDGTHLAYSAWKPRVEDGRQRFYVDPRVYVHDLTSSTRVRIETQGPNTDVFSWVDPCNAPAPNAAARTRGQASPSFYAL